MKRTKFEKGVTLITLVVTVVVLIILATVAVASIKDNNIIASSNNVVTDFNNKLELENNNYGKLEDKLNNKFYPSNGGTSGGTDDTSGGDTSNCSHVWGDWIVTQEATCQSTGLRYRVCNNCGQNSGNITIAKTGHVFIFLSATPACDHRHISTYICKYGCGYSQTDTSDYEGHWPYASVSESNGKTTFQCICGLTTPLTINLSRAELEELFDDDLNNLNPNYSFDYGYLMFQNYWGQGLCPGDDCTSSYIS